MPYPRLSPIRLAFLLLVFSFVDARSSLAAVNASLRLRPANFTSFFVTPNRRSALTWKAPAATAGKRLIWKITNYDGNPIATGATVCRGHKVQIHARLARGFYVVTFPSLGQKFGVLAISPHQGRDDPFFGVDSVMAWLVNAWHENTRNGLLELLHRSGIGISRDRLGWGHINPAPGKIQWNRVDRYGALADDYMNNHIRMLQMFQESPRWTHPDSNSPYPVNLVGAAASWTKIGEHFRKAWAALEIWNEPEGSIYGGRLPADQYVPIIKTIAYAFEQADLHIALGGGAFMGEDPGNFQNTCAMNGMLNQVDFVSFHDYHGPLEMEHLVGAYRRWLAAFGKKTMPLWITESGKPWLINRFGRPTRSSDRASALSITMKAVQARACGIARYFPFDYPFYAEGANNFSLVDRDHTPLRSMAAYVNCVAELSGSSFVGELKTGSAHILLAPVFAKGKRLTAVLYTGHPNSSISVRLKVHGTSLAGIDGRMLTPAPDGTISIPDGLAYLRGTAAVFKGRVQTHTRTNRLYAISRQRPPVIAPHSPIILQFIAGKLGAQVSVKGYVLTPKLAAHFPLSLRVWNLSRQARSIQLVVHDPGATPARGAVGLQRDTVPAQSCILVHREVGLRGTLGITSYRYLQITGVESAPGHRTLNISPLAIGLKLAGNLKEFLSKYKWHTRLALDVLPRWQPNIAASGRIKFSPLGSRGIRMRLAFNGPGGRWAYPKFQLPRDKAFRQAGGLLLRVRVQKAADVHVMLFDHGVAAWWTAIPIIPADGKWHVVLLPLSAFGPLNGPGRPGGPSLAQIQQISVGLGNQSRSGKNTLEISAMYALSHAMK